MLALPLPCRIPFTPASDQVTGLTETPLRRHVGIVRERFLRLAAISLCGPVRPGGTQVADRCPDLFDVEEQRVALLRTTPGPLPDVTTVLGAPGARLGGRHALCGGTLSAHRLRHSVTLLTRGLRHSVPGIVALPPHGASGMRVRLPLGRSLVAFRHGGIERLLGDGLSPGPRLPRCPPVAPGLAELRPRGALLRSPGPIPDQPVDGTLSVRLTVDDDVHVLLRPRHRRVRAVPCRMAARRDDGDGKLAALERGDVVRVRGDHRLGGRLGRELHPDAAAAVERDGHLAHHVVDPGDRAALPVADHVLVPRDHLLAEHDVVTAVQQPPPLVVGRLDLERWPADLLHHEALTLDAAG